jgi:3-methyladenine DNA glycosylase Tag
LGSWWEIFENGDRGSTQNFDSGLAWGAILEKKNLFRKSFQI